MSESLAATDVASPAAPERMGERLRAAREAANLSIDEIAGQLRLSSRQVEALEAEEFGNLPGRTFVRGFVRNYARLLKLDPEPLLAYAAERIDAPVLQAITGTIGEIPAEHAASPVWQRWAIFALLAAALAAGLGYEWYRRGELPGVKLAEPQAPASDSGASPATDSRSIELPTPALSTPAATPPTNPVTETPAPAAQASAVTPPAALLAHTETPKPAPLPAPTAKPAPSAAGRIGLAFDDACWVEIRERGGHILLSQRFSAGQTSLVEGRPPFDIVIGNARVTRLTFDGKPVELASRTHQNVARLTLP